MGRGYRADNRYGKGLRGRRGNLLLFPRSPPPEVSARRPLCVRGGCRSAARLLAEGRTPLLPPTHLGRDADVLPSRINSPSLVNPLFQERSMNPQAVWDELLCAYASENWDVIEER